MNNDSIHCSSSSFVHLVRFFPFHPFRAPGCCRSSLSSLSGFSSERERQKDKSPSDPLRHVCRLIELHTQRVNALASTYRSRLGGNRRAHDETTRRRK